MPANERMFDATADDASQCANASEEKEGHDLGRLPRLVGSPRSRASMHPDVTGGIPERAAKDSGSAFSCSECSLADGVRVVSPCLPCMAEDGQPG